MSPKSWAEAFYSTGKVAGACRKPHCPSQEHPDLYSALTNPFRSRMIPRLTLRRTPPETVLKAGLPPRKTESAGGLNSVTPISLSKQGNETKLS